MKKIFLAVVIFTILILVLSGVVYIIYEFTTAEIRVKKLCDQIIPGIPISQLRDFAAAHGLNQPYSESGINFMVESKTFGRYGCKVTIDAGIVKNAEYSFSD